MNLSQRLTLFVAVSAGLSWPCGLRGDYYNNTPPADRSAPHDSPSPQPHGDYYRNTPTTKSIALNDGHSSPSRGDYYRNTPPTNSTMMRDNRSLPAQGDYYHHTPTDYSKANQPLAHSTNAEGQPWEWMDEHLEDEQGFADDDASRASVLLPSRLGHVVPHWGSVEYLQWWAKGQELPPLVTTSPQGTSRPTAGVLGLATTTILYGGDEVNDEGRGGGRVRAGYWFDSCESIGIGGTFWMLGEQADEFHAASLGNPILARPFLNVLTGNQDSQLVAYPGIITGDIGIRTTSNLLGADLFLRKSVVQTCRTRIDVLAGYQYSQLGEQLGILENGVLIDPGGVDPVGTTIQSSESFEVENQFHGCQLGMLLETQFERWTVNVLGKVGLGGMRESATVSGSSTTTFPGGQPVVTDKGRLLALPTNEGQYNRDVFAFVPELGVNFSYRVNCHLDVGVGYSLIYWSDVIQAGSQIDPGVNPPQITGPLIGAARPTFPFSTSDFWVQGASCSLSWHY